MLINLFYELKKYEGISYADPPGRGVVSVPPRPPLIDGHAVPVVNFPIQHFGKEIFHHSYGNKLHKVQESAASAVGDKLQARGKSATQISSFKMCLMARAY